MDETNQKLEELKLAIQIWQHHDEMFWNRFNSFGTLVTLGLGLLGLLFTTKPESKLALVIISVFLFGIGLFWFLLLRREHYWIQVYIEKAKKAQKSLSDLEIMYDKPIDFFLGKVTSYWIMKIFLFLGMGFSLITALLFLIFP